MSASKTVSAPTAGSSPPSAASLLFGPDANVNNNNVDPQTASACTETDALGTGENNGRSTGIFKKLTQTKATPESRDYKMDYSKRGYAVIINNENFHWSTGMNKRTGTDVDAKNLKRVFKKLGFNVNLFKDQTCVEMYEIMQDMANANHTGSDCFMCAILSHGDDGCLYGTDGILKTKSIVNQFRGDACPTLAGKPKIFIFQACRGTKHEIPVPPALDVVDGDAESVDQDEQVVVLDAGPSPTLPSGSDFLFCYSVVEGYYSHRDTLFGSWYVQDFTAVVEERVLKADRAAEPINFLDILTEVNRRVSLRRVERCLNVESLGKKQMSCFLSMLTKRLLLTRKEVEK